MRLVRIIGLWAPVAAFIVATWALSDASTLPLPENVSDKLLHAVAYAVFGLFCLRAWHGGFAPPVARATIPAMLLTVGYGAVDEIHQRFVPGRFSSFGDWIADAAGAAVALAGVALWFSRRPPAAAKSGEIDGKSVGEGSRR